MIVFKSERASEKSETLTDITIERNGPSDSVARGDSSGPVQWEQAIPSLSIKKPQPVLIFWRFCAVCPVGGARNVFSLCSELENMEFPTICTLPNNPLIGTQSPASSTALSVWFWVLRALLSTLLQLHTFFVLLQRYAPYSAACVFFSSRPTALLSLFVCIAAIALQYIYGVRNCLCLDLELCKRRLANHSMAFWLCKT
ncbi:uncharacterized protein ASCRUDRAFT_74488 [Ascoidea rubescens DSM 1968]|uniref:Uncharacterized protein n=1 Tax=Ascoidea rubescens DSM 1968 TaxID=1344418 RepID=A0A1D2VNA5_9ASCO|nr:hypothetical protein ASCRUDRAFT_74488 [Ascoidea rubescens DSM 1968]ODV63092.1 hypothetical protein ASCRUDRAFT_74488 [Ascoidea rubescens DSM 1968]